MIQDSRLTPEMFAELFAMSGHRERLLEVLPLVEKVPMIGDLYQLTFNLQGEHSTHNQINKFIEKHLKKEANLSIMEIMSGNAFESSMLKELRPQDSFSASDIDIAYFDKLPGIDYYKIDCTNPNEALEEKFDVVFVGGANASMCMLQEYSDIEGIAAFLGKSVKQGGLAVLSYIDGCREQDAYKPNYIVRKIEHNKYIGCYSHWFFVELESAPHNKCGYHCLLIVTEEESLYSNPVKVLYNPDIFITRFWDSTYIFNEMTKNGFTMVGDYDFDSACCPFIKK